MHAKQLPKPKTRTARCCVRMVLRACTLAKDKSHWQCTIRREGSLYHSWWVGAPKKIDQGDGHRSAVHLQILGGSRCYWGCWVTCGWRALGTTIAVPRIVSSSRVPKSIPCTRTHISRIHHVHHSSWLGENPPAKLYLVLSNKVLEEATYAATASERGAAIAVVPIVHLYCT